MERAESRSRQQTADSRQTDGAGGGRRATPFNVGCWGESVDLASAQSADYCWAQAPSTVSFVQQARPAPHRPRPCSCSAPPPAPSMSCLAWHLPGTCLAPALHPIPSPPQSFRPRLNRNHPHLFICLIITSALPYILVHSCTCVTSPFILPAHALICLKLFHCFPYFFPPEPAQPPPRRCLGCGP